MNYKEKSVQLKQANFELKMAYNQSLLTITNGDKIKALELFAKIRIEKLLNKNRDYIHEEMMRRLDISHIHDRFNQRMARFGVYPAGFIPSLDSKTSQE